MKTHKKILIAALILLLPFLAVGFLKLSIAADFRSIVSEGNEIVEQIYKYKCENGSFPDENFKTIQGKKNSEFYYSKNDDGSFVLWTQGFSVGESIEYDSNTKEWKRAG